MHHRKYTAVDFNLPRKHALIPASLCSNYPPVLLPLQLQESQLVNCTLFLILDMLSDHHNLHNLIVNNTQQHFLILVELKLNPMLEH